MILHVVVIKSTKRTQAYFLPVAFWSWLSCARLCAENIHIPLTTPEWPPRLIFAGACHGQ